MDEYKVIENIKNRIFETNPTMSEELLDLLYEYMMTRYTNGLVRDMEKLKVHSKIKSLNACGVTYNAKPSECY